MRSQGSDFQTTIPLSSPSNLQIAGLLFDMGDVLYDATAWRRWLLQLLARMGLHTHYQIFFRVWEREYLDQVHRGEREYWEALRSFLNSVGLTTGQIDEVCAASHASQRELDDVVRPLPGVSATLAQLATRDMRLGVLCNAPQPADGVARRLESLGLKGYFSTIISSFDIGYTKPDPASYQAAISAIGLPADQVAFVGHDSAELDGATAVGMRTIAFNHDCGAVADISVERFEQISQVIGNQSCRLLAG